ncbi:hypothetical protein GCK32_007902 [Trichostrongylus colubriformis]|uniref:Uncharacterized protein n=1 Tax=Trichostrongylus colubriformis TaxID=6319 RepID=A0AAN8INK9_TRICO
MEEDQQDETGKGEQGKNKTDVDKEPEIHEEATGPHSQGPGEPVDKRMGSAVEQEQQQGGDDVMTAKESLEDGKEQVIPEAQKGSESKERKKPIEADKGEVYPKTELKGDDGGKSASTEKASADKKKSQEKKSAEKASKSDDTAKSKESALKEPAKLPCVPLVPTDDIQQNRRRQFTIKDCALECCSFMMIAVMIVTCASGFYMLIAATKKAPIEDLEIIMEFNTTPTTTSTDWLNQTDSEKTINLTDLFKSIAAQDDIISILNQTGLNESTRGDGWW